MNMTRRLHLLLLLSLGLALAQDSAVSGRPRNFGVRDDDRLAEDPRDYGRGQFSDFPTWPVNAELPNDVFTFARVRYPSYSDGSRSDKWTTDYPDADMNFSYRLQQMTSLQTNPNGAVVDIEAEQLRHYPLLYMIEVGNIDISTAQAKTLRDYMLNGGFIMVDDFWGTEEWEGFEVALNEIFPDRKFVELELNHDIFHCIFDLKVKPQIPSVGVAMSGRFRGMTHEWNKPGSETPHFRAYYDDQKRICMIICWNTDLGDGWEEEGTDPWYFREFSEKYAYPLGINIFYYALTH
jgi:Domain of unknown function (DUF4159)